MQHLLVCLRSRDKDRALAFTTIGLIAVAVEKKINPHLPKVTDNVKAALPAKVRNIKLRFVWMQLKICFLGGKEKEFHHRHSRLNKKKAYPGASSPRLHHTFRSRS